MNIGHLARALLGDARIQVQDAKSLELKVGQVVRGVVVQMLDGEEAIISLNGTQVRATLETPLQVGQATWLQVQPDSTNGSLILRAAMNGTPSDEMVTRLLQQLGLKDTPVNRELLRQAGNLGIQLTAKDGKALSALLASPPASSVDSKWIQSALITLQRGLPLTQQTVQSIMTAVHGTPLPQQLGNLLDQLHHILGGRSGPSPSVGQQSNSANQQLLGRLADAISEWLATAAGRAASSNAATAGDPSRGTAAPHTGGTTLLAGGTATGPAMSGQRNTISASGNGSISEPSGRSQPVATTGSATQTQGQAIASAARAAVTLQQGAASVIRGEMTESLGRSGSSNADPNVSQAANSTRQTDGNGQQTGRPTSTDAAAGSQGIRTEAINGTVLRQLFQTLGLGYEHELKDRLILQQPAGAGRDGRASQGTNQANPLQATIGEAGGSPLPQQGNMTAASPGSLPQTVPTETIKGLLLQAAGNEQLPASLRESIQQAAQTITGQQLLLTADRSAPLTYVTMSVPFLNEQGEPMANVHIQTRKGKRGELDSNNCHLFFDLRLASLGEMLIDVQVTERIVGLRVYNDHPFMQALIEEGKPGIRATLEDMGYRLASFATAPLPVKQNTDAATEHIAESTLIRRYAAGSSYKGVDLRV